MVWGQDYPHVGSMRLGLVGGDSFVQVALATNQLVVLMLERGGEEEVKVTLVHRV